MNIQSIRQLNKLNTTDVYYLASPYSHKDAYVRHLRYETIDMVAAKLFLKDFILIEPIGSCHSKSLKYDMPTGYKFWQTRDRKMIEISDAVLVITLPGWKESTGVTDEIEYAESLGRPVYYVNPKILLPDVAEIFSCKTTLATREK